MIALSKEQRAALDALRDGPRNTADVATAIGVAYRTANAMLSTLKDRGFLSISASGRGGPSRFIWSITTPGRAAIADGAP